MRHLRAIIDTGAETSAVSENTLRELGLVSRNKRQRISSSGESYYPIYHCAFELHFQGLEQAVKFQVEVGALELDRYGTYALIGRDVLRHCDLHYYGPQGRVALHFTGVATQ